MQETDVNLKAQVHYLTLPPKLGLPYIEQNKWRNVENIMNDMPKITIPIWIQRQIISF